MSVTAPYSSIFGPLVGRGNLEHQVLNTLSTWIVTYIAEYERQNGLVPRSTPIPPSPDSIHGGIDFETFETYLCPELIAVCTPMGETERHESGRYGEWFSVAVAAVVYGEGSQDATRALADVYGTAIAGILAQQGMFGLQPDGITPFATRTRLFNTAAPAFPNPDVRDVLRTVVVAHTFIADLVSDMEGPLIPPPDPYATPANWPQADLVEVDLIRGTPDTHGAATADEVVRDNTVVPEQIRYQPGSVDVP